MNAATTRAATLAARTPADRDRYVDLLRVLSIGAVVAGHWLMAVVTVGADGAVRATNVLAVVPWLQWLTWLLQVMPVFFLVGGFSHTVVLRRRATSYVSFVRSRAGRLLRPTAVFVAAWFAFALFVELAGRDGGVLRVAARTVAQPLWFIGVYLGIVALAPAMLRLHVRLGTRAVAVPVALAAAVAAVDVLRFALHVPSVGYLNVALVWLAVHQIGFLYADGALTRRSGSLAAGGLAISGLGTALALTVFGPYPVSMVGVPGEAISNMSPPTLVLLAHAVWLTGLVLLVREPVSRWLQRPRVWLAVVVANGYAMTVFLWHMTALFAVTALTLWIGVDQPAAGTAAWWLTRPAWLVALALATVGLVAAFRRADGQWRTAPAARIATSPDCRRAATVAGTGTAGGGMTGTGMAGTGTAGAGMTGTGMTGTGMTGAGMTGAGMTGAGMTGAGMAGAGMAGAGMALAVVGVLGLSAVGFAGPLSGRTATLVVLPVSPFGSAAILAAGAVLLWLSRSLPAGVAEPVPTRPVPTRPAPAHPVPTHPAPTHPVPTHPAPTHPAPTHPAPTQLTPAHPAAADLAPATRPTTPTKTPTPPTPTPTRPARVR